MKLLKILSDSAKLLFSTPKFFIPRILTTAIYTVVTLYTASITAKALSQVKPDSSIIISLILLLAFMPLLYLFDVLTYAMYPKMVSDKMKKKKISLRSAFSEALKSIKSVIVVAFVVFVFALFSSLVFSPLLLYSLNSGNIPALIVTFLVFLLIIIIFSIIVFFVIPSSVISKRGVAESFRESYTLGIRHRWPLFKLNMVFAVLAVATLYLVFMSEITGEKNLAAILSFILVRAIQAVVYTYLCITNPRAYLDVRNY
ncbi:MAG: hypothetical protein KKD39_04785 [Candidatus Altiarchaeota archaeon]|nr:hypothetical protein [Candidatus Altiarchaeota archaeon]